MGTTQVSGKPLILVMFGLAVSTCGVLVFLLTERDLLAGLLIVMGSLISLGAGLAIRRDEGQS